MEKRGFFFSLDSFLAIILFTVILVMLYIFFIQFSPLQQQYYFSEDLLTVYSNVNIKELDLSKYSGINTLITDKKLNETDVAIIEQVATFYLSGDSESATAIMKDLSSDLFKDQYGVALDIGGEKIYEQGPEDIISLLARQRLIIGKRKL